MRNDLSIGSEEGEELMVCPFSLMYTDGAKHGNKSPVFRS